MCRTYSPYTMRAITYFVSKNTGSSNLKNSKVNVIIKAIIVF